jgi:acyl dehydratase
MTGMSEPTVGQSYSMVLVDGLTRTQLVLYAGASGDFNPLHTDEVYAVQNAGQPSVFGHGMLTMGMTARLLTDYFGVDRLAAFGGRFTARVWPGDTLTATADVTEMETHPEDGLCALLQVTTRNQHGTAVFAGHARVRLPGSPRS